jgi:ribosome biogenesis GTPase / thiamine phosphate phosphatase
MAEWHFMHADFGMTKLETPTQENLDLAAYGWSAHFQQAAEALNIENTIPVRVASVHRDALDVAGPDFTGRIPLAYVKPGGDDNPTVGDWIALDRATLRLAALYPRTSLFKRRNAGNTSRSQSILANVDAVLIVTSANLDFNVARLERYLALAFEAGVAPVIVITKADLADDAETFAETARAMRPDLAVLTVNARGAGVAEQLAPWLVKGRTIALMGSSGVGKSTLVNALMGASVQDTGGIREDDSKGRHTTSGRSLHRLASGAWLIDTPGMRELQVVDVADGIDTVFDDISTLIAQCRFSDCSHVSEPGCAVRAAIECGDLEPERLARFQKLAREERHNSEAAHQAHARSKAFGKMTRKIGDHKTKHMEDW